MICPLWAGDPILLQPESKSVNPNCRTGDSHVSAPASSQGGKESSFVLVFAQLRPLTEWTMPTLIQKDPHRPHQSEPKINYHDWHGGSQA